eukprot:gnl/Chilomastix_caulleri/8657.p1 GENE.gnl/Chilomastix_caulleri/8657~~gnl/Chilomastix_caulleri/8657.p1  ORF type:complete len:111 (+),score=29.00 gnl/Chilomastix_caulleri/8657:50-382(+)
MECAKECCECKEGCKCEESCSKCCCCKCEFPPYFENKCARRLYMKTLVKEEAKRFCCYAKKFQGLGMGMGTWVPNVEWKNIMRSSSVVKKQKSDVLRRRKVKRVYCWKGS